MAINIQSKEELDQVLGEIWRFHERCPEFSGTETDADILLRRLNATDLPVTVDSLQQTFEELKYAGLLQDHEPTPPPQPESVQAEPSDDDAKYDAYEILLDENVKPEDITLDGLLDSLPSSDIRGMIEAAQSSEPAQRQTTLDDEINSLSPSQLRELIFKVSR